MSGRQRGIAQQVRIAERRVPEGFRVWCRTAPPERERPEEAVDDLLCPGGGRGLGDEHRIDAAEFNRERDRFGTCLCDVESARLPGIPPVNEVGWASTARPSASGVIVENCARRCAAGGVEASFTTVAVASDSAGWPWWAL